MAVNPIVTHMAMLLDELEEEPLRAAYMVVSQLHELQKRGNAGRCPAIKNKESAK